MKLLFSIIVFLGAGAFIMLPQGANSREAAACSHCHKNHKVLAKYKSCYPGTVSFR